MKPSFDLKYNFESPLSIKKSVTDQNALDEDIQRYRRVFGAEVQVSEGAIEQNDRVSIRLNRIGEDVAQDEGTETVVDLERSQEKLKSTLSENR